MLFLVSTLIVLYNNCIFYHYKKKKKKKKKKNYTIEMQHGEGYWIIINIKIAK